MRWGGVLAVAASCLMATAAAADDFERAVLAEINFARTQPGALAERLRDYRAAFDGRVVREDGDAVGMMTAEGTGAVDEAIAFLEQQPPLPPLDHAPMLAHAASGWAAAQGPTGAWGHGSGALLSAGARMRAAGGDIYVGETISYGMGTAAAVVRQLIVDDGQPRRGHRALVFTAGFRHAGVGCGAHARFRTMCVIDYAGTADGSSVMQQVAAVQPPRAIAFNR